MTSYRLSRIVDLINRLNNIARKKRTETEKYSTAMLTITPDTVSVNVFFHGRDGLDIEFTSPVHENAWISSHCRRDDDLTQAEEYLRGILEVAAC